MSTVTPPPVERKTEKSKQEAYGTYLQRRPSSPASSIRKS